MGIDSAADSKHTSLVSPLYFCAALLGQTNELEPIVTDRPDVAESSQTVPSGSLQVETGVEMGRTGPPSAETTTMGFPTKLRFGVIENVEAHLEGTLFDRVTLDGGEGNQSSSGLADVDVGGKVHLFDPSGLQPSLGVLLAVTLPVGAEDVSGDQTLLKPTVAAEWDLHSALSLATNAGFTIPLDNRDRSDDALRFAGSLGLHPSAFPAGFGVFGEIFGELPLREGGRVLATDFGVTYGLTPRVQLDAYVRLGLSEAATDTAAGGGVSLAL